MCSEGRWLCRTSGPNRYLLRGVAEQVHQVLVAAQQLFAAQAALTRRQVMDAYEEWFGSRPAVTASAP